MSVTVISKRIEEVPEFHEFTKADFIGDYPGITPLDYDPFPEKKPNDVVRREIIAQKLVLRAKLKGDVLGIRPGFSVRIDNYDFAVSVANIAINTNNDGESTSEIEGEHFLTPPDPIKLLMQLRKEVAYQDEIYRDDQLFTRLTTDISLEIKQYLANHPEKLHNLTSRRFEELIADILKDLGFDTELTPATRDGGRDIYAYVKNAVTSFLMFVECKKWASDNKVGIDIVQRLYGAAKVAGAHKSMIVTTSFFTAPAQQEQRKIATEMELKDYNELKTWLSRYI
jgi:hypothetical protein